jgi:tetraacyldisaccharide-1-P 4'-kinase
LQNAKKIGRENYKNYLETCKYLGDEPAETDKSYFIPTEIETVTQEWFNHMVKVDPDILILDDELYTLI